MLGALGVHDEGNTLTEINFVSQFFMLDRQVMEKGLKGGALSLTRCPKRMSSTARNSPELLHQII